MRFFQKHSKFDNALMLRSIINQKKVYYYHFDEEPNKLYLSLGQNDEFIAVIDVAKQKALFNGKSFKFEFDMQNFRANAEKIEHQTPALTA